MGRFVTRLGTFAFLAAATFVGCSSDSSTTTSSGVGQAAQGCSSDADCKIGVCDGWSRTCVAGTPAGGGGSPSSGGGGATTSSAGSSLAGSSAAGSSASGAGGTSAAGQGGTSAKGGAAGSAGKTGSAGSTASGGTSGSAGKAGSTGKAGSGATGAGGGTSGPPAGIASLGSACTSTTACGTGMTCLLPSDDPTGYGGPSGGYCTAACSTDAQCGTSGACVGGVCYLRCSFGAQPFTGSPDPTKCRGRAELACDAISPSSGSEFGVCIPQCSSDAQCPADRRCDGYYGTCVAPTQLTGLLPDGAECDVAMDAMKRQCVGACAQFIGKDAVYVDQENLGHCTSGCVLGASGQCGNGDCLYSVTSSAGVQSGWGDFGFCAEPAASSTDDSKCDVGGGFFASDDNGKAVCEFHAVCSKDADCASGFTCRHVSGSCGSFCLDRDPTWPANASTLTCPTGSCCPTGACESPGPVCWQNEICYTDPQCCLPVGSMSACL